MFGLVIGLYGLREWRLANASQNWPSTTGVITQSKGDFDSTTEAWDFDVEFDYIVGECTNNLVFKVMLPSGRWIKLNRQATWQAGRDHYRRNIVHFPSRRVATIEQKLTRFRDAHEPRPYVSRIELRDDTIALEYSDGRTEDIPQSECLALQICKEDCLMRYSRYEINLVLSSPHGKRISLVSYDNPADEEPADIEQIGAMFALQTMDHL